MLLLKHLPSWEYDTKDRAFKAVNKDGSNTVTAKHADELIEAFYQLPDTPVSLTVWSLTWQDTQQIRKALPDGSLLRNHIDFPKHRSKFEEWVAPQSIVERKITPYNVKKAEQK